jgi:hypothetical protein
MTKWFLAVAVAAAAVLAGCGGGGGNPVAPTINAEAMIADGDPSVKITWDRDSFQEGIGVTSYEIWRDYGSTPIASVAPGPGQLFYLDTDAAPGVAHNYHVSATIQGRQSEKVPAQGPATPLPKMPLDSLLVPWGGESQNLHKVVFQWRSLLGADSYILEVSTNPTFSSPEYVSNVVTAAPSPAGQIVSITVNETLYALFRNVPGTQSIYWRVGARAAGDTPGPVPPAGRPDYRYIYSEINSFHPIAAVL